VDHRDSADDGDSRVSRRREPRSGDIRRLVQNSNNYQGTQDLTDASQVTIGVGVGGGRAYGPAAARVTVGTTVRWEWTGKGGQHNVLDEDGTFESVLTAEAGHTFTTVIDQPGVYRYYCTPHQPVGMVGALHVVE
jgi:halocyanin domain